MLKNPIRLSATLLGMALVAFTSCEDQDFTDVNNDATRVEVNTISAEMAKVRDYVAGHAKWVRIILNPIFSARRTV